MADDWFSDLVTQVSAEVIASQETKDKLALTDRVTADKLTQLTAEAVDQLRLQFAAAISAIQDLDDEIEQAEHVLLAPEWNAFLAAQERATRVRPPYSQHEPGLAGRVLRFLHLARPAAAPFDETAAAAAVIAAVQAYQDAKQAKGIAELDPVKGLATRRLDAIAALAGPLRQALAIMINAAIDRELAASYERVFSFTGKAELGDPLALAAQPVDTDALRRLKYLIEDVGSGTIGVAGPRGSGKSTLLRQFATTIRVGRTTTRWGLYVPAPAKYDARDFLLYLFARLCAEVLGPARTRQVEDRLASASPRTAGRGLVAAGDLTVIAAIALTCWGLVVGLTAARLGEPPERMTDLLIACCSGAVALISVSAVILLGRLRVRLTVLNIIATIRGAVALSRPMLAALAPLATLTATFAIVLFGLLSFGVAPKPAYLAAGGLGAAGVAALILLAYLRPEEIRLGQDQRARRAWFPEPLYDNAAQWYAKAKFQQTYTTGWSGTLTVGAAPLPQAQGGLSGSSEVTALAMAIPEVVEEIKKFIRGISEGDAAAGPGQPAPPPASIPVVIAIDEIDKIDDPADAQSFFNQIKGLFGDTSAVFLISISDDAMASFERRGLPFRDAFDSSLSSVVTLSYLTRAQARELIGGRIVGVQEPVADLLYVLSGGLARDLVRLIRRAVEARQAGHTSLDALMLNLISGETEAKRKAVLATARSIAPCPARRVLLDWAGTQARPADPDSYYAGLLDSAATLLATGCRSEPDADPDSCPAREIGTLLCWLGTTGQVFTKSASRDDFVAGQSAATAKSFDRLAHTRQDFPLGASYVLPVITAYRTAWALPVIPGLP